MSTEARSQPVEARPPIRSGSAGTLVLGAVACDGNSSGGLNRYTTAMVGELLRREGDKLVYVSTTPPREWPEERLRRCATRATSNFAGNLSRLLWHNTVLPRRLRQDGAVAFYSPVPEGMLRPVVPQVITVHDVLPLLFPDSYPRLRHYARHVMPRLIRASAAVIVDSHSTARDVHAHYPVGDRPIHVVHPGYDSAIFRPVRADRVAEVTGRYGLDRYVLAVGETRPYKNIRRLIEAFARIDSPDLTLAVVGSASRLDPGLTALPGQLGSARRVRFLGRVPDEELAALYSGAAAFVFPSLYEGFGLPPLEAMACETPVVASSAASIPEVCGDAAMYVDPLDIDELTAAIQRVVSENEVADRLRERGRERVKRFSYVTAAAQVEAILGEAAERGTRSLTMGAG